MRQIPYKHAILLEPGLRATFASRKTRRPLIIRLHGIHRQFHEYCPSVPPKASRLQKLPASNDRFIPKPYNCDSHTFNYLVQDGFAYCVVADESVGSQVPLAFLERIEEDFKRRYGGGKADTAVAHSLDKEFGSKLKEHMQYCVDHPEEISKLAKAKAQVSEVKGVMKDNIDKVLDRGANIDTLVGISEDLHSQAGVYRGTATKLHRKMWFQNMKIKLIVLGILVAVILIIVLSVCHGFNCGK